MRLTQTLVLCASFVAFAVAQSDDSRITFTTLPSSVEAGEPVTLEWEGGDNTVRAIQLFRSEKSKHSANHTPTACNHYP